MMKKRNGGKVDALRPVKARTIVLFKKLKN